MIKSLKTFVLTVTLVITASSVSFAAADNAQNRMQAAIAYEKAVPVAALVNEMLVEISKNPQMGLSQEDIRFIQGALDTAKLRQQTLDAMVRHFTTSELEALAAFYGSPEGQSIMKKMPTYMSDTMPIIQQGVMESMQKAMAKKYKR